MFRKKLISVRIVVPAMGKTLDSMVSDTLGRAPFLILYDSTEEKYTSLENPGFLLQDGSGLKSSDVMLKNKADVLLTREIGRKSYSVLMKERIDIHLLESAGTVKDALNKFIKEKAM